MKQRLGLITLVALALIGMPSAVIAAPTDIDGDGVSDFVLVSIEPTQSLTWQAYSGVSSESLVSVKSLGMVGDHLALGNWTSLLSTQLAYIRREGTRVYWYLRGQDGLLARRKLGRTTDTFVSGADFDGNGYGDGAIVREESGGLHWIVKSNFFRNRGVRTRQLRQRGIGLPFYANPHGKRDWVGVIGPNPNGDGVVVNLQDLLSRRRIRFKYAAYSLSTLRPLPVRLEDGRDVIALVRRQSNSTPVQFVSLRGQRLFEGELPGTGELIVGDYSSDQGHELGIQTASGFTLLNPTTGRSSEVTLAAGIPVDDVNVNSFSVDPENPPCNDQIFDPFDGPDKFLWKPVSETRKTLVVLLPTEYTGKVDEVVLRSASDEFIERASIAWLDQPGARTFARFTRPGASYPVNVKVVAKLKGGCFLTWQIPTPSKRVD